MLAYVLIMHSIKYIQHAKLPAAWPNMALSYNHQIVNRRLVSSVAKGKTMAFNLDARDRDGGRRW